MALDPTRSALGRLLLAGWGRRGDSRSHGTSSEGHALAAQGVIDGLERLTMRVEDLLERFHQILEQVKPISALSSLWSGTSRSRGIVSSTITTHEPDFRMRTHPSRDGFD